MVTKGPLEPSHRHGKCMHDPTLGSAGPSELCGAPAALHLLMLDPDELWTTYVCTEHEAVGRRMLEPIDWHDVASSCIAPGAEWQAGANPGDGFCLDDELDAAVHALALGLQGVAL